MEKPESSEEAYIQTVRPLNDEEVFFRQKYWEYISNSPGRYDEHAKSLIKTVGTLMAVYSAAITFSKIVNTAWWFRGMALIPIVLWLFAVIAALMTLVPMEHTLIIDAPASIKGFLMEVKQRKYRCVKYCGWFTFAGLIGLMVILVLYLFKSSVIVNSP